MGFLGLRIRRFKFTLTPVEMEVFTALASYLGKLACLARSRRVWQYERTCLHLAFWTVKSASAFLQWVWKNFTHTRYTLPMLNRIDLIIVTTPDSI